MRETISHKIESEIFEGDYRLKILQVLKYDGRTGIAVEYGVRPFDEIRGVTIPDESGKE